MSGPNTFSVLAGTYRKRADEAHEAAAEANLANVRERCLRAEAAWTAMADRLEYTEELRTKVEEEKRLARLPCGSPSER